ncbi:hypothetical protein MRX96_010521 [Rhipicephalus microplus]
MGPAAQTQPLALFGRLDVGLTQVMNGRVHQLQQRWVGKQTDGAKHVLVERMKWACLHHEHEQWWWQLVEEDAVQEQRILHARCVVKRMVQADDLMHPLACFIGCNPVIRLQMGGCADRAQNPKTGWSFGARIEGAWPLPGNVRELMVGGVEGRRLGSSVLHVCAW